MTSRLALALAITLAAPAAAQEEIQYCFLEVANATGLAGDLQVAIDDQPIQGGKGYRSGASTGALGLVPDTFELKFRHPSCPEVASLRITLAHEENALVAVYYVNKTDPEDGEIIKELQAELLKPEPTPGQMNLSLVTIDPRAQITSLQVNRTDFPMEPSKLVTVPIPRAGNYRITHGGQDIIPALLVENEEHHLVYAFVDETSRSVGGGLFIARTIRPAN